MHWLWIVYVLLCSPDLTLMVNGSFSFYKPDFWYCGTPLPKFRSLQASNSETLVYSVCIVKLWKRLEFLAFQSFVVSRFWSSTVYVFQHTPHDRYRFAELHHSRLLDPKSPRDMWRDCMWNCIYKLILNSNDGTAQRRRKELGELISAELDWSPSG